MCRPAAREAVRAGEAITGYAVHEGRPHHTQVTASCPSMPRSALLPDHTGPHRRCGFSAKIIEILNSNSVSYDTFDILQDEEVSHPLCAREGSVRHLMLGGASAGATGAEGVLELADIPATLLQGHAAGWTRHHPGRSVVRIHLTCWWVCVVALMQCVALQELAAEDELLDALV